jgi:thiamine pyrophosphate-dependent acetolactate synthase large subunit-like protein
LTFFQSNKQSLNYFKPLLSYCLLLDVPVLSIQAAKHPLLIVGAGGNRKMTSKMLREFVAQIGIPFCDTQMGKGVIDSSAPPRPSVWLIRDAQMSGALMHAQPP